jgi:hypothetical protein
LEACTTRGRREVSTGLHAKAYAKRGRRVLCNSFFGGPPTLAAGFARVRVIRQALPAAHMEDEDDDALWQLLAWLYEQQASGVTLLVTSCCS